MLSAYELISDVIDAKKLDKEEVLEKLDVFLFANRISKDQYTDLINKVKNVYE